MRGRVLLGFALAAFVGTAPGAQTRVTLSLGHSAPVRDVTGRPDLDRALSVGDDGRLVVWDLEAGGKARSWQISTQPLTRVAIHPTQSEAVVFVRDGVGQGRLVGLDWESGEELFSERLNAPPEYLAYSPQGTYVVVTLPSFDSVRILDAETGARRRFLTDGFGIVSFVQIARSERNVMTYVPSRGDLIYWELATGRELRVVATRRRLSHVTLIDPTEQRLLAARDGDSLVVVDNLSGEVRATYPIAPIHGITFDAANDRILVLTEQMGRRTALAFTFENGRLRRDFYRPQNMDGETTVLAAVGGGAARAFVAGSHSGAVALYEDRTGRRTILGPAGRSAIADFAFTPGRLHLSLGDRILTLTSDLFGPERSELEVTYLRDALSEFEEDRRLRMTDDGRQLLVWDENDPGTLYSLMPPSSALDVVYDDDLDVPILDVGATERGALIVHRDGRIVDYDFEAGVERFRYTAVGAQAAVRHDELGLIVAKTNTRAFDSSIIVVDELTRETVAAETDAFITTALALDPDSRTLYAIGLHGDRSSPEARLTELTGRGFDRARVLERVDGESLSADLDWDDRERALVSSLEPRFVRRYSRGRESVLQPVEQLHRDIEVHGSLVAARNEEGSISFWDRESGEHLMDLTVIGSEWIAISTAGRYLASSGAARRYLTLLPDSATRLTIEDFRIELPLRW